jgi:hypothetical protein
MFVHLKEAVVNYDRLRLIADDIEDIFMAIGCCVAWFCNQTNENGDGSDLLFVWTAVRI